PKVARRHYEPLFKRFLGQISSFIRTSHDHHIARLYQGPCPSAPYRRPPHMATPVCFAQNAKEHSLLSIHYALAAWFYLPRVDTGAGGSGYLLHELRWP